MQHTYVELSHKERGNRSLRRGIKLVDKRGNTIFALGAMTQLVRFYRDASIAG
jgi:hypothetical protein